MLRLRDILKPIDTKKQLRQPILIMLPIQRLL